MQKTKKSCEIVVEVLRNVLVLAVELTLFIHAVKALWAIVAQ